jgi:outer membrane protein assembly factor BamB
MHLLWSLLWLSASLAGPDSDWPRFLGPNGNGTSPCRGLIRSFPPTGPEVCWSVDVGAGYGGVAVRDGEVVWLDRETGSADRLRVFDLEKGVELWSFSYDAPGRLQYAGSRCVPTVEEELVYLQSGLGQVYCVDRDLQEEAWSLDFQEDYEAEDPGYGWCQAPLVWGDLVIVAPLADEVSLVGLDRLSGEEIWRTAGYGFSHSSPTLVNLHGREQIVFLSARLDPDGRRDAPSQEDDSSSLRRPLLPATLTYLSSFLPATGDLLWQTGEYRSYYPIPVPVQVGDEHLLLTSGYTSGSALLQVQWQEDQAQVKKLFQQPRGSQIHVPIQVGDHFYLLANENDNDPRPRRKEGGLMCMDRAGQELWRTGDSPYFGRGCMIYADGLLIVQDGYNGVVRLIEPSPEGYRPLAEANLFGIHDRRDRQMWAPLALADGRLLLRSQRELKCVDLRSTPPGAGSE